MNKEVFKMYKQIRLKCNTANELKIFELMFDLGIAEGIHRCSNLLDKMGKKHEN